MGARTGSGPAVDRAAWSNRWRDRSVLEKSVLSLGLLVVAMATRPLWLHAALVAVCLTAILVGARVEPRLAARVLTLPVAFIVIGALAAAVSIGHPAPDAVWSFGPFWSAPASIERSVETVGRSLAAASALMMLALTTPMTDLLTAARRAKVPATMVEIAGLVYRMLFVLLDVAGNVRATQEARLGYASARIARASVASLLSATLRTAWVRAQRLGEGLEGRGFDGALVVTPRAQNVSVSFVGLSACVVMVLGVVAVMTR